MFKCQLVFLIRFFLSVPSNHLLPGFTHDFVFHRVVPGRLHNLHYHSPSLHPIVYTCMPQQVLGSAQNPTTVYRIAFNLTCFFLEKRAPRTSHFFAKHMKSLALSAHFSLYERESLPLLCLLLAGVEASWRRSARAGELPQMCLLYKTILACFNQVGFCHERPKGFLAQR